MAEGKKSPDSLGDETRNKASLNKFPWVGAKNLFNIIKNKLNLSIFGI